MYAYMHAVCMLRVRMYVCMYMQCMLVCTCTHTHTHMHARNTHMSVSVYLMYVCTYIHDIVYCGYYSGVIDYIILIVQISDRINMWISDSGYCRVQVSSC